MHWTPLVPPVSGFLFLALAAWLGEVQKPALLEVPKTHDPRLVVTLFAAAPDIVHPIALDFDAKGRLLVIESHTHFPPKDYPGPKHDRIRVVEDTDGDGKADRFTTYYEGLRATMDLAVHPSGTVYVATRNEILRLHDDDGDGKADRRERLVFLDTKGDYPHNGLSGLCFDAGGNLTFGLGENLGAAYKLIGADGTTLIGEGEGGIVFHCSATGKQLRRIATGFWNPYGIGRDVFDRYFVVDNDPDAMPPCRLLHLTEGGDYGYQFRYGRSGRHVFQAWNGQLPGTLPMVAGTGEAPCEVISYESDGLPPEYLGSLLVTSWADHRIERYVPQPSGSSFRAERQPFVQGGRDFRPVGLAVAPDGSLFVSDWVLRDYTLHHRGALWHVRPRAAAPLERTREPQQALFSRHRPLREAAAARLAATEAGRKHLIGQLTHRDVRVSAASLTALAARSDLKLGRHEFPLRDEEPGLRALAVRKLAQQGEDVRQFLADEQPAEVRREAITGLRELADLPRLRQFLAHGDPFLRHAAVQQLAVQSGLLTGIDPHSWDDPRQRAGLLLAFRASVLPTRERFLPVFLNDPDEEVRFLATKWVADEALARYRPQVLTGLQSPTQNVRMYAAYATALARLDGQEVSESKLADTFLLWIMNDQTPPATRRQALLQVPASHKKLTLNVLTSLATSGDPGLQREAVRALADHPDPKRYHALLAVVQNERLPPEVQAYALAGLAGHVEACVDLFLRLAGSAEPSLRAEALRGLVQAKLTAAQRQHLEKVAVQHADTADLVARVLGQPFFQGRPPAQDLDAWIRRLEGPASASSGRRIFSHGKVATCARCHRAEGRGFEVGPELSTIGRIERRQLLEAILQPSANVAPHYQAWVLATADGKVRTGLLTRTYLDEYTYLDSLGQPFTIKTGDLVETRPASTSIMPDGLADQLTDQELRDLLAYLASLR